MDENVYTVDTSCQSRVAMRRVQFIEIHEQPWFPSLLRDEATDALQFGFHLLNVYGPVAPLLQGALDSIGSRSIVDLCSGGGGPWFELGRTLQGDPPLLRIWLTDQYPNPGAVENVRTASENHVQYYPGSVDATKVPDELQGFRTMFTSFHHFSPQQAGAVLQNAADAGEGIGVFEITRRAPSTILLTLAWALLLFLCTPWIRPFRWSRLFWTYLVPIIPLVLVFDGVVSCLRSYRPEELREIVGRLRACEYQWEIGETTGWLAITYLIGHPRGLTDGSVSAVR
jgi:hypothetical protein